MFLHRAGVRGDGLGVTGKGRVLHIAMENMCSKNKALLAMKV